PWNGVQETPAAAQKGYRGRPVLAAPIDQRHHLFEGKIPLGAFENRSVRHDSGVAHGARERSDFQNALLADHIAHVRHRAVSGDWCSGLTIPGGISYRLRDTLAGEWSVSVIQRPRIEDDLTRPLPVVLCPDALGVEVNGRLLLFEPCDIPGRPPSRRVYGVAPMDRAHGDLVVEVREYVHGRVLADSQRQFERSDCRIVPGFWNIGRLRA